MRHRSTRHGVIGPGHLCLAASVLVSALAAGSVAAATGVTAPDPPSVVAPDPAPVSTPASAPALTPALAPAATPAPALTPTPVRSPEDLPPVPPPAIPFRRSRPEIRAFIAQLVAQDGFKRRYLERVLSRAVPQQKILDAVSRPAERVTPWWQYREHFLTEERIREGVEFWARHREALDRISAERGVDPEYIVAIIGIETFYGRLTGRYRVLDALATLAFDYPPRSAFFRGELEQFLLLAREERVDPLTTLGSYAGAMGAGQFMPSSYRQYAVDEDGDGRRDLWNDWDDVIASVANYLRLNGWQAGVPVLAETTLDPGPDIVVDPRNLELNDTIAGLHAKGVEFVAALPPTEPAMLVLAEAAEGPMYRVGFSNFHVITRYNHSVRYAMAVHDLATALDARMGVKPT